LVWTAAPHGVHSVEATAANVHDSQILPKLAHGQEKPIWGDAAYSEHRHVIQHERPMPSW
jgi:IS5 family transposase